MCRRKSFTARTPFSSGLDKTIDSMCVHACYFAVGTRKLKWCSASSTLSDPKKTIDNALMCGLWTSDDDFVVTCHRVCVLVSQLHSMWNHLKCSNLWFWLSNVCALFWSFHHILFRQHCDGKLYMECGRHFDHFQRYEKSLSSGPSNMTAICSVQFSTYWQWKRKKKCRYLFH